jgi:FKBP-type peptidyl-prolyl cis-trans isomerase
MRSFIAFLILVVASYETQAFSLSMRQSGVPSTSSSRREFFTKAAGAGAAVVGAAVLGSSPQPALAAPEIFNTPSGIKYAVLKESKQKGGYPQDGDIVAIEYTGYLTNGQIWDSTHGNGRILFYKLGTDAVIDGVNEMVSNMMVGQKVQAIIPAKLAFGDKGLCLEDGECLIKPGSTLVYDIFLKKMSIPPP